MMTRMNTIVMAVLAAAALAGAAAAYTPPTTTPATPAAEPSPAPTSQPRAAQTQAATAPAPAAADANSAVARLVAQVLADPANAAARNKLAYIRDSQEVEDLTACQALVNGLEVYIRVGAEAALPALERAACSKLALALTASMSTPLDKWLSEARREAQDESAARKRLCSACGGSGQKPCPAPDCYGSGKVKCDKCKGTGSSGASRTITMKCPACDGSGVVACRACDGTGLVDCPCQKVPGVRIAPRLAEGRKMDLRRVIDQVRWLRAGGIDLYTDGALRRGAR
jgi:hypothetical protein